MKSIIELMIPYYIEYNKAMTQIITEANKLLTPSNEPLEYIYEWDIMKDSNEEQFLKQKSMKKYKCVICGRLYDGHGNLPIIVKESEEGEGCCNIGSLIELYDTNEDNSRYGEKRDNFSGKC